MPHVGKFKEAIVPGESSKFQVPESLPLCADLLYSTRQARLELQKQVDELESREKQIRQHLITTFLSGDATGSAGKIASVALKEKEEPQVEDWDAAWKYIVKKKAFDLVQRRISAPAVKARWENNEAIPGVKAVRVHTISVTKV